MRSGTETPTPAVPAPAPPPAPPATRADAGPDAPSSPTPVEESGQGQPRRLLFRDARNGDALPGVRFSLRRRGGQEPPAEFAAAADGTFVVPKGEEWTLSFLDPNLRSLRPAETFSDSAKEVVREVWCYWTATVTGIVDVEDPSRIVRGTATVSARPVGLELLQGQARHKSREVIGTPAWVQKQKGGGNHFLWTCAVKDRQYSLEIPLIGPTAVMAWAPGHTVEMIRVDPGTAPGAVVQANFRLRTGVRARIRVLDESGVPVANASVQLLDYFVGPSDQIDHAALSLEKKVGGFGLGIVSNGETGMSRASLSDGAGTGDDGRALVYVGSHERRLLLMVSARGKVPFIKRLERPDEFDDAEIVLKRNQPARPSYRLSRRGRFAGEGATLQLLEMIDTMTLGAGTVTAAETGHFPADSIVPRREYFVILNDPHGIGRCSGTVTFGDDEVVDISSLESR
ncbi:MAG TPA: hypothetical protein VFS92_04525 [Planctomycetota bacterium]|nr:hypothetical protein [Planctomycetota bacterium]